MARHGLLGIPARQDQGDFPRTIAEAVLQPIMEVDVDGLPGAGWRETQRERMTWRDGYRDRVRCPARLWLDLRIPELRQGSDFPGFPKAGKTRGRPWQW